MEKKIYRSKKDQIVSGVCAGFANYFNIDPTIVRIVAVVLLFASFFTFLLAYFICVIIIPEEPADINSNNENYYDVDYKDVDDDKKKQN